MAGGHTYRRRIAGAILLDLAVSPLFIWNIFADPLARAFHVSSTQTSLVFSLGLAAFGVGVLAGGRLADTMAPRWLAAGSALGMFAGLGLAALAPSIWGVALGFGVLQGGAAGLGYATAVHEAGLANRGLVMALVVSAYGAGSAVLAPPMSWLLAHYGHTLALGVLAVLAALACGAAALLLPGRSASSGRRATSTDSGARVAAPRGLIGLLWLMFGLGSAPGLAAFALAGGIAGGAVYAAVVAVNVGNLGGRLIAGPAADRFGTRRTLHASFVLLIAACGLLFATTDRWLLDAGLLAVGAQYGALSTLMPLAARAAVPEAIFGRIFGLVFSAWAVFGLAAPAAGAALSGFGGNTALAAAMLICALLAWLAGAAMLRRLRAAGA